ncbi:MAG: hypothetical protein PF505_11035 [Vallitaleaceae bacterium]|jgi:hypothetical protein|nr:hypothetical protein [Vallitaleaceae bacterium]
MLNKYFKLISLKVKNKESRGIRFFVPFITLTDAYGDFVDLMVLLSLIMPGVIINTGGKRTLTLKDIAKFAQLGEHAVDEMILSEPFDLVDVESPDAIVKIRIR